MLILKKVFTVTAALFLSACTQASLFAVNAPVLIPDVQMHKNIIFDAKFNLSLDLYQPDLKKYPTPLKIIVFFYGGSWREGSKDHYKFLAGEMIKHGYLIVIPNYRKYPDVKFPTFVQDGAKAVAWVTQNVQNYNADPAEIILMGHSAGAHMAALLASDKQYLKQENIKSASIKAVIGLSGPYAFTPKSEDLKAIFGPPEKYPLMHVPNYIDGTQPPMLLLHGKRDTVVGQFNLERLQKAINDAKGDVQIKYYDDLDHVGTVAAFSWARRNKSTVVDDILIYLKALDK